MIGSSVFPVLTLDAQHPSVIAMLPESPVKAELLRAPSQEQMQAKAEPHTPVKQGLASSLASSPVQAGTPPSSGQKQGCLVGMFKLLGATFSPESGFNHKPPAEAIDLRGASTSRTMNREAVKRSYAAQEHKLSEQLKAKAARLLAKADQEDVKSSGQMKDLTKDTRWSSHGGRPKVDPEQTEIAKRLKARAAAGLEKPGSNRRMVGAPVLRRDPQAFEKLFMLSLITKKLKEEKLDDPKKLSTQFAQGWQDRVPVFHYFINARNYKLAKLAL